MLIPSEFTAKVVDRATTVQGFKPRISKIFRQSASTEFLALSLRGDARKGRGSGLRVSVRENTPMVQDWAKFLKDSSNKAELFHLIVEKITRNRTDHKMVWATQRVNMIFLSTIDIDRFSPCNHEEANTRMFLHLKNFVCNRTLPSIIENC